MQRSIAKLTAIIDSVPTAIVMLDPRGEIDLVNAQAERLFGYTRQELLGERVEMLVPERFRGEHAALRQGFAAHAAARPMGLGRDLFGLHKDGTEFPIEIGLSPVPTDEGLFVVSAVIDIRERTRHAEALHRSNDALARSNLDLQRFAHVASHDLQTPMRSIASFVELLRESYGEQLGPEGGDWLRRTAEAVGHLRTLVRDLLDYARVDAEPRPFTTVSMREVVERAASLLDASVREAGAEIRVGELPDVSGDASQLSQLVLNLLGNALKYRSAEPPVVEVSAEASGDDWVLSVRDNGIGIAERHRERIFEMFKRLHDAREYPGTGIGLAVCRRIVSRHGGTIWVEGAPGAGSTFRFTLPRRGRAS